MKLVEYDQIMVCPKAVLGMSRLALLAAVALLRAEGSRLNLAKLARAESDEPRRRKIVARGSVRGVH